MRKVLFFPLGMVWLFVTVTAGNQQLQAQQRIPSVKNQPQRVTVDAALKKLEKKNGVTFVYDKTLVKELYTSFDPENAGNSNVEEQLKSILYPNGLLFLYIKKDYYAIVTGKDKNNNLLSGDTHSPSAAPVVVTQFGSISGRVTDEKGAPLERISIQIAGTNKGAYTNENGEFTVAGAMNRKLLISGIGYSAQEITPATSAPLKITLASSSRALSEVVVVGYGEQKKANMVGAVNSVSGKELAEAPVARASDALAGRVPGIFVTKTNGAPGAGSNIYIRGISTTNDSKPLIVIDGIPDRNLDNLSPADIATVSVLKDASAIAVYGARAANGVLLVTTRKGNTGKASINFTANTTIQQQTRQLKPLGSYEYAQLYNVALKNENSFNPAAGKGYSDEVLEKFRTGSDPDRYPNTDWYKAVLSPTSLQQRYDLSVSGGNDKTQYYVSAGYNDEGGFYPATHYKRYNLRSNLQSEVARGLIFNLQLAGFMTESINPRIGNSGIMKITTSSQPFYVNQFSNGQYGFVPAARGNVYRQSRGEDGYNRSNGTAFNGNISLQYAIPYVKGLSVKGLFAYDRDQTLDKVFSKPNALYTMDKAGNMKKANNYPAAADLMETFKQTSSATSEVSVNYDRTFRDHHIGGMLLYTQTMDAGNDFSASGYNFVSPALEVLNAADPTNIGITGTGKRKNRQGVVGRLIYDFSQKYLLEMNFRYDGSDIFPPGSRFGFFPSIGAGWVISKESFFRDVKLIDFLKLRGSWGLLGNDRVDPYQFLSTYNIIGIDENLVNHGYSFGGTSPVYYPGLELNVLPNPAFTWEKAVMSNIGFDMQLWDNRISVSADYFYKRTKDILAPRADAIPDVIGVKLPVENAAIVDNKGFEISMGYENRHRDFSYYVRPNLTYARNKVVYYPEAGAIPEWQRLTGKSVGLKTVPKFVSQGLYQSQEEIDKGPKPLYANVSPGDIRYADIDGDGKITFNDKTLTDRGNYPEIQYGISLGGRYKGLELNMLWQGSGNIQAYVYGAYAFPFGYDGHVQELHKDYWTPENRNASFPRLFISYPNNTQESDYWLHNASYIRLKNLELAYNLPAQWLRHAGIRNVRIYVSGNNLLTFSRLKQIDPEAGAYLTIMYPMLRSYNGGINIQL
ncbi:TonB-dependent receptor [Chitinophaga sp. Mgbs1]|uniref:TonB-dependent receptor n=1 Tax=Chitinophaga solisilvae TaxID=1233460 RepID=A0A3S1CUE5_9BACT|nr:TonB-dependent receptor [Chitinophaga solisilvae]